MVGDYVITKNKRFTLIFSLHLLRLITYTYIIIHSESRLYYAFISSINRFIVRKYHCIYL